MKYIALVLLVLAAMAIACSNGPTPTPDELFGVLNVIYHLGG